jgi:hypothetical protein
LRGWEGEGGDRVGGKGRGCGQGAEMTQDLHAHMNNKTIKNKNKPNSIVTENKVLTHTGSFQEMYVFHQFSCKGLSGRRRACLHNGKPTKQGVLL